MWGSQFAKIEDEHFRLQETKPRGWICLAALLEPIQDSSSLSRQYLAAARMNAANTAVRLQMGGSLDSYSKAGRLLAPGHVTCCLVSWAHKRLSGIEKWNLLVSKWLVDWLNNSYVHSSIESPNVSRTLTNVHSSVQGPWGRGWGYK